MKIFSIVRIILKTKLLVIVLILSSGIVINAQKPKIVFATHWLPQAQFAGYYVALDQGFYDEAGLDVEIIHATTTTNSMEILESGKADVVSAFLISAMHSRCDGLNLVNIAQLSQHSAILFVSKKSGNIKSLEDFNGKKIGIWNKDFSDMPRSLIKEHKLNVEWVPILSSVNLFLMGGVDILTVMYYNEYHLIYLSGINHDELNTVFLSDFGYDIPEDGLYTLQSTYSNREKELKAFTSASLKGWEYAANNRDYTVKLVVDLMRNENIPTNIIHQRWMLDKILGFQATKGKSVSKGELDPNDFEQVKDILQNLDSCKFTYTYSDFFKPLLSKSHNK
ncbi:MAG TPA: ABC transporter substrate-binding protein [Bacteroidales bacterium]|nr:ABC transporter substrate-binding protein [Bacteroidales bacterium]